MKHAKVISFVLRNCTWGERYTHTDTEALVKAAENESDSAFLFIS